jgi:Chaperone of endosialidase
MQQPSPISFESRSINLFLVAIFIALLIVGTVRPVGAQNNTFFGTGTLGSNTTGTNDTALGFDALFNNTTGLDNTATGTFALVNNSTGFLNTANGAGALANSTIGSHDTAIGTHALLHNLTGGSNTATGFNALGSNTTGGGNVAVGANAGSALTTGDNNIDIGNVGVAAEANAIRIGTKGTHTRTLIAGIDNSAIVGSPVFVNANGRLGIEVSSARFKRDIRNMGAASDGLMKLRPVTFRYRDDPAGTVQYGLVAEEVARVYPELVTYGDDGKAQAVAYHMLPAMLLNEVQKEIRESQRKTEQIGRLTARVAEAEAGAERKDFQIAALQRQLIAHQKQINALQKETAWISTLARLRAVEEQARATRPEPLVATTR